MTDVRDELWAALLEAGKVRWMPGMLARRMTGPCHGSHRYTDAEIRAGIVWARGAPDWDDPATLGCLTAMAREAWGNEWLETGWDGEDWSARAIDWDGGDIVRVTHHGVGSTEAEALLRAIKAAP